MNNLSNYLKKENGKFELSYLGIRQAVGWLGVLLPLVLVIGTRLFSDCPHIKDSISDYFYTIMGSVLVGILCGVALFLFSYKGFDNWDNISSNIAALFALGVAFFPMNVDRNCVSCTYCNILSRDVSSWRDYVHFGSATIFFFTLACMSLFLFTKTHKGQIPTGRKKSRNIIYKTCGIVILAAMAMKGCLLSAAFARIFGFSHDTLVYETIMLWAFGFSWLIKGEFLLKDQA